MKTSRTPNMKHKTSQVAGGRATCRCGDAAADVAPGRGFQPTSGAGDFAKKAQVKTSDVDVACTMIEDYDGYGCFV